MVRTGRVKSDCADVIRPQSHSAPSVEMGPISITFGELQARKPGRVARPDGRQRQVTGRRRKPGDSPNTQTADSTKAGFVPPMLAKLVRTLPEGPGWSFEVKFDGYRIEAIKNGPEVRLQSRRELLLEGYYERGKLFFAGKVRQGLNPRIRAALLKGLTPIRTPKCPFSNLPTTRSGHSGEVIRDVGAIFGC
jgi:hypothetical protein